MPTWIEIRDAVALVGHDAVKLWKSLSFWWKAAASLAAIVFGAAAIAWLQSPEVRIAALVAAGLLVLASALNSIIRLQRSELTRASSHKDLEPVLSIHVGGGGTLEFPILSARIMNAGSRAKVKSRTRLAYAAPKTFVYDRLPTLRPSVWLDRNTEMVEIMKHDEERVVLARMDVAKHTIRVPWLDRDGTEVWSQARLADGVEAHFVVAVQIVSDPPMSRGPLLAMSEAKVAFYQGTMRMTTAPISEKDEIYGKLGAQMSI